MAKTPKCVDILRKAIQETRFMSEDSAIDLWKDLEKRTKAAQQKTKVSRRDALQQVSDKMIDEQRENAKLRTRNAYLDLARQVTISDFTKRDIFKSRAQGLNAAITGDLGYGEGARASMYLAMRNSAEELNGDLYRSLSEQGVFRQTMDDKDFGDLVMEELFNQEEEDIFARKGSVTGNDNAFAAAKAAAAVNEKARKQFNKAGGNIKRNANFIASTTHEVNEMLSATGKSLKDSKLFVKLVRANRWKAANAEMKDLAYLRWRDHIMPLLDRERTFEDVESEDIEKFMRGSYDALVTGRHLTPTAEDTAILSDFKKVKSVGRSERFSMSKVFHFKGGKEWGAYNDKYGTGSLGTALFHGLNRIGKNIGIMKKFGPSSTKNYNVIVDDIRADASQRRITGFLAGTNVALNRSQHMWDFATGRSQIPDSQVFANWAQAFRDYTTLVRLPLVVITAFQDVANRAAGFKQNGMGFFERWRGVFQQNLKGLSADRKQEVASLFRVWNTAQMGIFTSRMAAFDSPKGAMSKAMQLFWRYNGMNRWDRVNTQAHALTLGAHLGSLRELKFEGLPPEEQRLLRQYDIRPAEWEYYRRNATFVAGTDKTTFIAPDIVRQRGNAGLDDYLDALGIDKTPAARETALDDLSDKLGGYFIDRTAHAILVPDLRESTFITGGTRPGTVHGEFMKSVGLFKTFSVSFARKMLGRPLLGGNLAGNPDIMGIIEILATSTILGGMILDMKLLGQGKEPRSFNGNYVLASMLQGGGLGIFGDFLFGEYNRFGQSLTGTFAGPVLGTIDNMATFFDKLVKMDHPAEAAFQFFGRNTPFLNMYFAKTALNYLFLYSLAEHISPGYLHRMQRRMADEQNQDFLAAPSQFALRPFG